MNFETIINLLYIDRGYSKNQALFLRTLLQKSVNKPDQIDIAPSTLKEYFYGNNITRLAPMLMNAGLSVDKLSAHIESLYETKHKATKTYQDHFFGKSYKEELFERAKKVFPDITLDNMSKRLADTFYTIIKNRCAEIAAKNANKHSNPKAHVDDVHDRSIIPYTLTDPEKSAIKNLCRLINDELETIKRQTADICKKQTELTELTDSKSNQRWKAYLEIALEKQKTSFLDSYSELERYCTDVVDLLKPKQHLHTSMKNIYDIASGISSNAYKITYPTAFNYSAFSAMISNFRKNYKLLLSCIDGL